YLCLRRGCRPGTAVLATGVMLTVPLLIELENSVMLEIPMMAMVCLTLVAYFRLIDRGQWTGWREAVVAALLSAAVVYTKQPGVFFLPSLLLDLAWNHRHILRQRQTWLMIGLVVLLCLPLGIFTLTYGRVNMQQSFGNAGNIYIEHHRVADRWSIDGWTYYLREIALHVDAILCGLAAAGALAILWRSDLRRRHSVWLAYAVCWYVPFTLFDH